MRVIVTSDTAGSVDYKHLSESAARCPGAADEAHL